MARPRDIPTGELVDGVVRGDRTMLGRALTLIESSAAADHAAAEHFLSTLPSKNALRFAVTGAPGAGKSTFLEACSSILLEAGSKVGVLAIDPSSTRSGGSILGDKTRMTTLSRDPRAFVRPTPSSGALGGVAPGTREGVRVLEAAGFDVVIVETVGVGQSEVEAASLVDTLVWITGPSSGDELQGIKRGLVETVDVVVVNKADAERVPAARITKSEIEAALRYVTPATEGWVAPVLLASALEKTGLTDVLDAIRAHRAHLEQRGLLAERRARQNVDAFRRALERSMLARLRARPELAAIERDVASGNVTVHAALERALALG
jgi:LAO/AO transport system kinase